MPVSRLRAPIFEDDFGALVEELDEAGVDLVDSGAVSGEIVGGRRRGLGAGWGGEEEES